MNNLWVNGEGREGEAQALKLLMWTADWGASRTPSLQWLSLPLAPETAVSEG